MVIERMLHRCGFGRNAMCWPVACRVSAAFMVGRGPDRDRVANSLYSSLGLQCSVEVAVGAVFQDGDDGLVGADVPSFPSIGGQPEDAEMFRRPFQFGLGGFPVLRGPSGSMARPGPRQGRP